MDMTVNQLKTAPEPFCLHRRIGSTVYEVHVFFNQDAKETMDDKIMRLIRNEAAQKEVS